MAEFWNVSCRDWTKHLNIIMQNRQLVLYVKVQWINAVKSFNHIDLIKKKKTAEIRIVFHNSKFFGTINFTLV